MATEKQIAANMPGDVAVCPPAEGRVKRSATSGHTAASPLPNEYPAQTPLVLQIPGTAASPDPNNALKHGLSAETMVVPGEDAAELEAFHGNVRDLCQPRDAIEESIVRQFVMADWRGRRFSRIESGAIWAAYNESATHYGIMGFKRHDVEPKTPAERDSFMLGSAGRNLAGESGVLTSFSRYEASIRRSYFLSLQMILSMRAREMADPPAVHDVPKGGAITKIPISQIEANSNVTRFEPTG